MFVSVMTLLAKATIATCGGLGAFAVVSPTRFKAVAQFMSMWVETRPTVPLFDSRYDIDSFVLRHTRGFGALVMAGCALWWALFGSN